MKRCDDTLKKWENRELPQEVTRVSYLCEVVNISVAILLIEAAQEVGPKSRCFPRRESSWKLHHIKEPEEVLPALKESVWCKV